jgi:hemoglobin-like flavoprotein
MKPADLVDIGPKQIFLDSLRRCDASSGFLERFYERFMATSPEVTAKFADTDFQRQRTMLRRSLHLIALASAGDPDGLAELNARAETHSRAKLDIPPHLYDLWLQALIETARDSDPDWTEDIETAWRQILGIAIRHMIRQYEG